MTSSKFHNNSIFMILFLFLYLLFVDINGYYIGQEAISSNVSQQFCGTNLLQYYNHTPFNYVITEKNLCSGDVFLVTYVQTSSYNYDKRMVIRNSFGSLRYIGSEPIRLLFIIGRPHDTQTQINIYNESKTYRDIVQADFKDTYHNLTLKHIVSLGWISKFCPQAQFISKTDDDTFINPFLLVWYLKEKFDSHRKEILGQISYGEIPIRQKNMKWKVTTDMYSNNTYPPFTKGFAYVISQAAIKPLFICSYYQRFLYIDDIFVTGLVAPLAGVKLVDFQRFFGHTWISTHNITMDIMENIFVVSQTEYHVEKWIQLWRNTLQMEL